jgi:hypothetical protein
MAGAMGRPRWSRSELAAASPEVVAAARWELFATRLWVMGRSSGSAAEQEAVIAQPDEPNKNQLAQARRAATNELGRLRRLLLPPDEPAEDEAS